MPILIRIPPVYMRFSIFLPLVLGATLHASDTSPATRSAEAPLLFAADATVQTTATAPTSSASVSTTSDRPANASLASPQPVTPPAREKFHLYLLVGQSNMVGRDTRTLASQVENPRILALNGPGQWIVAREPMHVGGTGVGPGIPFAAEMLKANPDITIGLVPCAVGGTPLRRWVKGGDLYERAIQRAKRAAQTGILKGVLWHQGESDTEKKENAETYHQRLAQMLSDLRIDLEQPNLPVVVGQLGEFLDPKKYVYVDLVRQGIAQIPSAVPHTNFADSSGLGDKGDKLHFSADAEKELGARLAAAMRKLQE